MPSSPGTHLTCRYLAQVGAGRARRDEGVWRDQMTEEQRRPARPGPVRCGNSSEFRDQWCSLRQRSPRQHAQHNHQSNGTSHVVLLPRALPPSIRDQAQAAAQQEQGGGFGDRLGLGCPDRINDLRAVARVVENRINGRILEPPVRGFPGGAMAAPDGHRRPTAPALPKADRGVLRLDTRGRSPPQVPLRVPEVDGRGRRAAARGAHHPGKSRGRGVGPCYRTADVPPSMRWPRLVRELRRVEGEQAQLAEAVAKAGDIGALAWIIHEGLGFGREVRAVTPR